MRYPESENSRSSALLRNHTCQSNRRWTTWALPAPRFSDCTACGKCVEICPVTPFTSVKTGDEPGVIKDVLELLRNGASITGAAQEWTIQFNGCGLCIPACPVEINPRRMLMLANTVEAEQDNPTPQLFRKMSRAIHIMAAMQLAPPEFDKLLRTPRAHPANVVFKRAATLFARHICCSTPRRF